MALDKQVVPVSLRGGLDTKTDAKNVIPGKLLTLQNGVFTAPGRIGKRNGYTALTSAVVSGSPAIAGGSALMNRQNELLLVDGTINNPSAYTLGDNSTLWNKAGEIHSFTASSLPLYADQYSVSGYDAAVDSATGLMCAVFETFATPPYSGFQGTKYIVIDTATSAVMASGTVPNTGYTPKVIVTGGFFTVLYVYSSGGIGVLAGFTINTATLAVSASSDLTDNPAGGNAATVLSATVPCYDAVVIGSSLFISYVNNVTPTNGIRTLKSATTAPLTTTANRNVASLGAYSVNVFAEQSAAGPLFCYVTTNRNTAGFVAQNAALSSTLGSSTDMGFAGSAGLTSCVGISVSTGDVQCQILASGHLSAAGLVNPKDVIFSTRIISGYTVQTPVRSLAQATVCGKPIILGALQAYPGGAPVYVPVALDTNQSGVTSQASPQNTWFLARIPPQTADAAVIVAKAYAGTFSGFYNNSSSALGTLGGQMMPESSATTDSIGAAVWYFPAANQYRLTQWGMFAISVAVNSTPGATSGLNPWTVLHNPWNRAELAADLLVSGACPQTYDGTTIAEHGFLYYPVVNAWQVVASGGGSVDAGVHQYAVCYEWTDAQGQVHRSTPSVAQSITISGGNQTVTLTIPYLYLSLKAKANKAVLTVYRTKANQTVFYQLNNLGAGAVLSNSVAGTAYPSTTTYVDTAADSSIGSNPQLYTTGGVVNNAAPNPLGAVVVHRNRIMGVDTTNPLSLWYSKQVLPGTPVEFSASFTLNIDPRGGPVTALGSLDEKLIVFKRRMIFVIAGQGPDSTGGQNDFSDSIIVSSDVGCLAPRSVIVMPDGLMFQSDKGFYLLDRSLQLSYIGDAVESFNGSVAQCATLVPSTHQVRFGLNSTTMLVYDYYARQWSTFVLPAASVDSGIFGALHVYLTSAGLVAQETIGSYQDTGSTNYSVAITTGWLSFAGIQGFQRIRRVLLLGKASGTVTLTATLNHDFSTTNQSTHALVFTGATDPAQYRIHSPTQKCETMQIALSYSAANVSVEISGLALEVGVKRGAFKLPAAQSA